MLQKLFAIRDSKADGFMPPFCAVTRGLAVRMFSDVMVDPQGQFAKHPADYSLHEIGVFDTDTALIVVSNGPEYVIGGLDVLKSGE